MALTFEVNQAPDREIKEKLEQVIQDFIGNRQEHEEWCVWMYAFAGTLPNYFSVVVKGPTQKREKMFFEDAKNLDQGLFEWLNLYPLQ